MLGEYEGKVARHLLGGHAPSIAKAVMVSNDVRDSLFSLFLDAINDECNNLCRKSVPCLERCLSLKLLISTGL